MAIDFGLKRTGLAVTDPYQLIATPLSAVHTSKLFDFLSQYFQNEQVVKVVVGYPLNLQNKETDATLPVNQFIQAFKKKFPSIPIEKEDEKYTSQMAVKAMVASGAPKKKRRNKMNIDKISATLILQSYLENIRYDT